MTALWASLSPAFFSSPILAWLRWIWALFCERRSEALVELGKKRGLLSPDRARAACPGASVPCGLTLDLLERLVSLAFLPRYGLCEGVVLLFEVRYFAVLLL